MRWVFALLLPLGLVSLRANVLSAQTAAVLSIAREEGAESCPDTNELIAQVARLRGAQLISARNAYRVDFSHRGGVFRATIRSEAGNDRRTLHDRGSTCASLAQAAAVTLALLLDSDAHEPPTTTEQPPPAKPPFQPKPPEREPAKDRARTQVSLTLSLGVAGLAGVVKSIAPAALGELGIGVARFRTTIGVLWVPTQTLGFGVGTIDETLLSGVARTCLAAWQGARLQLDLCSGIHAGLLRVRASGYTRNDSVDKAWLSVPLGLALWTTPSPVGVELGASALLPLRRNDFSIDGLGTVYESWPVGMLLSMRAVGTWLL